MENVVTLADIKPEEWTGDVASHHQGRIWWIFTPDTIGTALGPLDGTSLPSDIPDFENVEQRQTDIQNA